ncbi:hypothetical protein NV379_23055, partial [Paenibacillus sp. N1-5-1-14]|uniref:hypothetical protein n=1 Tax=Paenibacillus radicibacter TaxID=2972488 RepID=UPI0021593240
APSVRRRNSGEHWPDTSAPTKRIAPGSFAALSRWDVVNTTTLDDIGPLKLRVLFMHNVVRAIWIREEHEVIQISRNLVTACLALKIKIDE